MNASRPSLLPPILGLALLALLTGLWAGLLRMGWQLPWQTSSLMLAHGPLMVSGFLGSLIVLEPAVALRRAWMFLPPMLTGLGAVLTLLTQRSLFGSLLLILGSLGGLVILTEITRREFALHAVTMLLGALAWSAGNILWLLGRPIFQVIFFWQAFLVLTIAGERLELSRVLRPSRIQLVAFGAIIALLLAGSILSILNMQLGARVNGAALLFLALWSRRNDIAWRNLRHKLPLTRYIAWCLVLGFVWLGVGGTLSLVLGIQPAGPRYDAALHAVFIGFVISMIFGHAPIILPAILGVPITFHRGSYVPLAVLHISLGLRLLADYLGLVWLRLWGGLLNELAILWFLAITAYLVRRSLTRKV